MSPKPEPHVEITLREIYDKLCAVERQVIEMQAGHRSVGRYKALMYPTMLTAAGALVSTFVK